MATRKPGSTDSADPDVVLIRAIAEILADTGLSEVELERKGTKVRVSRGGAAASHQVIYAQPMAGAPLAAAAPPAPAARAEAPAKLSEGIVKSPMVGTAYRAPAPGSPNFIEIGAQVKQGQTLIIIEAMKTMNQIPSPRSGKVIRIMVSDRQPLEFGEPICEIE